jgi:cephalosporin-C deacetylase-like acetyl esterase
MLVGVVAWWIHYSYRVKWARDQALPQIGQLVEGEKFGEAYALAVQAEQYIPHEPMLAKFWPEISWSTAIHTTPSGVAVYRRNYNAPESTWELVGHTPIENRRFPAVDSLWKFERKGFATVERATFPDGPLTVTMDEEGKAPARMVHVELPIDPSRTLAQIELPGFKEAPAIPLGNFWIDKYEVTNAEYKRFVDQGGYQRQEYWKYEFRSDGRVLSWEEGMKLFQDRTGRPGPATWILGEYPHGQDNYPVTGVSWFEAAAYAEFVNKSLPTIYHWTAAAVPWDGPSIIPASNFSGAGPAAVGAYRGMSWSGAFDMAGNVKEWTLNEAKSGKHYILGSAWNEPSYTFYDADAQNPFERSANYGFRCAKYVLTSEDTKAAGPVTFQQRDYRSEKPVSDQVFRVYKSLYAYDKTPLHAVVEPIQQTDEWKEEKITFDAAYGGERMTAFLFLPRKASPPFQAAVHVTGTAPFFERSSVHLLEEDLDDYDYIVKSGRAVMFPVFKGMFERWDDLILYPKDTSNYRDHVIDWSKDLGRSIDYLETRSDIDHSRLAYHGVSFGGAYGALLPALEDRLKALVLISPGFFLLKQLPEEDQINFAPRVRTPVLMLNGRFDSFFPQDSSQEPMFRLLGTPSEHKRRVLYDTGHDIPRAEMIKEVLNWLDRYLGPVK